MKLHIGGEEIHPDWKIMNAQPGPQVDFLGNCLDLSRFEDDSVEAIYASHVFENLSHKTEFPHVIVQCHRILQPGGQLMVSVPNFGLLCQLFVADGLTEEQRFELMRIVFGGHIDEYDVHKIGLIEDFMTTYFRAAKFSRWERVEEFNIFNDTSSMRLGPHLISLNMIAFK